MKQLKLTIDLGNAEMREDWHIADALRDVARRIDNGQNVGTIRDVNGNTVGRFEFEPPEEEEEE